MLEGRFWVDKGCSPRLVAQLAVAPLHCRVPGRGEGLGPSFHPVEMVDRSLRLRGESTRWEVKGVADDPGVRGVGQVTDLHDEPLGVA